MTTIGSAFRPTSPLSRRRLLAGATAAVGSAALFGCQTQPDAPKQEEEQVKLSDGPADLSIWTNHDETTAKEIQGYIDSFKQANQGAKITLLNIGDAQQYYTKLKTAAIGKNLPDIFMNRTFDLASSVANGWLQPLDAYAKKFPNLVDLSSLGPSAITQNTINGKLYASPIDFSCFIMYINKTLFKTMGIDPPKADWTWDEHFALAERFKQSANGKPSQWGTFFYFYHWMFLGILMSNGGKVFSDDLKSCVINSPENVATMEKFAGAVRSNTAASPEVLPAGVMPFSTGNIAMELQGQWVRSWYASTIKDKFEWDIIQLPKGSSGRRDVATAGASWGVSANSKQPDWAYKVACHLSAGAIKTYASKQDALNAQGMPPANQAAISDQFKNGAAAITYPQFWSDFDTAWTNRSTRFVADGAAKVLQLFQDDVNAAAKRYS